MKTVLKYSAPIFLFTFCISCAKDKTDVERSYTKLIERIFTDSFEQGLIEKAEKYYPSRDSVLKAANGFVEIPTTKYWYYTGVDGVHIPYSITDDAINYYSDLIDEYNKNKKDNFFITAKFDYKAEVFYYENYNSPAENSKGEEAEIEQFNSVYVVKAELKWEDYCGSLCAMWIYKKREVVFNESGELLKVYLDGKISVLVS